ncbi:MAG: VWA domain-containing protein [Bacillota bacterium]
MKTDRYDRRVFAGTVMEARAVQQAVAGAQERLGEATGLSLGASLWAALYKRRPELEEEVRPGFEVVRSAVESAMSLPDYHEMRAHTVLDEWGSALGMCGVMKHVLDEMPEDVAREAAALSALADEAEKFAALAEALSQAGEGAEERAREYAEKAEQAMQRARQRSEALQERLAQEAARLRRAVHRGMQEAIEAAENACQFAPGWGLEAGSRVRHSFSFELAEKVARNPSLVALAREVGRLKELGMHAWRTRFRPQAVSVTEVVTGRDLRGVLPSELSYLSDADTEGVFLKKFAQGELLRRIQKSVPCRREGPVIVCVDTSGSMKGANMIWAKALALALMHLAARQRRPYAAVVFGASGEVKSFTYRDPRSAKPDEVLDLATFAFGGGTDFEGPLLEAVKIASEASFEGADVVFITDGECRLKPEALEKVLSAKRARGMRVWSVLMPGGAEEGVRPFSDACVRAAPGDDRDAVKLIFGNV